MFVYLMAGARFFLVLASLDAGSSFGGMGGSRESFMAFLIEPAFLLAMMTVMGKAGSSNLLMMADAAAHNAFSIPYVLSAVAFLIILVAETGRIPVDNPDTHLELTMVHEGMVLEYSGRYLALIHWASAMKQCIMIFLFVLIFIPWWPEGLVVKAIIVALGLAAIETSTNKMRLFRVPGFLAISGLLSLLALVAQ